MIALLLGLLLSSRLTVIGPGALSFAGDGTLERVASRRIRNGWGLTGDPGGAVLVAPVDCSHLGRAALAVSRWADLAGGSGGLPAS
jgi:hypothetical protein